VDLSKNDSSVKYMGIPKNCDLLEYNGNLWVMGTGDTKTDYIKTDNDFLLTLVLNMCGRFTDETETFKLVLSAPPLVFKQSELEFPEYFIGEHKIKQAVDGGKEIEKTIIIAEIETYPESFVAYLNNDPSILDNYEVLIFDIGGVTTNICYINKGNFKVDEKGEYYHTSRDGMFAVNTDIAQYLNSKYINYDLDANSDKIEEYRANGFHLDGDFDTDLLVANDDNKNAIYNIYLNHVKKCMKICKDKKWVIKNCKVIITGGGGQIMYEAFKELIPYAIIGRNPIFDTLNGLKELAE
jgi:hypothetical protein